MYSNGGKYATSANASIPPATMSDLPSNDPMRRARRLRSKTAVTTDAPATTAATRVGENHPSSARVKPTQPENKKLAAIVT